MESNQQQSNELILWLKALDLPIWAKVLLVVIMSAILLGAGSLLAHGLFNANKEEVSAATALLAISLPVMLIVTALVFGTNGEKAFQKRSTRILLELIPKSLKENLKETEIVAEAALPVGSKVEVEVVPVLRGCIASYQLTLIRKPNPMPTVLFFSVALNVYKANVVFWFPDPGKVITDLSLQNGQLTDLIGLTRASCVFGALNEGYKLNPTPEIRVIAGRKMLGLVFIKSLPKDFLLQSNETLYFAQDLAFFVRGFVDDASNQDVV
jgi:hypothetical protein